MTHLEYARSLVALDTVDPFWPAKLVQVVAVTAPAEWSEEIIARAGELAAGGDPSEVAQLAAFFEVRAARLLPADQLAQLEGPSLAELERDQLRAELAREREEAVVWWVTEYPILCGIRGVPPTLDEVPEFAQGAASAAWGAQERLSEFVTAVSNDLGNTPTAFEPLSAWSEDEIRHDWRGMTATEKRIYREAFERAKPHELERAQAARYAHAQVIEYRVRRAEATAEQMGGRSAA